MYKQDQPATGRTLERTSNNQFLHRFCGSADGRADEEECKSSQHDELAAPNVGERGPDGAGRRIGKEVRASNPGVACGRGEVPGYGWGGCGDDGGIEGRDE